MRGLFSILILSGLLCLFLLLVSGKNPAVLEPASAISFNVISDLDVYEDFDYGFTVAIPTGWTRIVADESNAEASFEDVGYAVGFEAGRQGSGDRFADYILIEVLPGTDSGAFAADDQSLRWFEADGQSVSYQELYINSEDDPGVEVDLIIYQREVRALGYTLGFYAIGEPANQQTLFDAFQIMLRTYHQQHDPFSLT